MVCLFNLFLKFNKHHQCLSLTFSLPLTCYLLLSLLIWSALPLILKAVILLNRHFLYNKKQYCFIWVQCVLFLPCLTLMTEICITVVGVKFHSCALPTELFPEGWWRQWNKVYVNILVADHAVEGPARHIEWEFKKFISTFTRASEKWIMELLKLLKYQMIPYCIF